MNSDEKALLYFEGNKVFPLLKNRFYELYSVDATQPWQIRYDILKDLWTCNCPNIRLTPCSHILATKMYRKQHKK